MTKTYRPLTVGELIELLGTMPPETVLKDISLSMGSYRGYYEHVYIEPWNPSWTAPITAEDLLRVLQGNIDTPMRAYKGGDYVFRERSYVFLAREGSTGPAICGFTDDGEPVVFVERYF